MCCECEKNNSGNYTYIAYATDLNGSNFSLNRTANGINRCYQAIVTSLIPLDVNQSIFQNYFYGRYYNICAQSNLNNYFLPTPQIAKRKKRNTDGVSKSILDSISPRRDTVKSLLNLDFGSDYYLEQLDIYFNSFGKENFWLSLPDKRLELCLVSNKNYKKNRSKTTTTEILWRDYKQGNKDSFHNAIVHPANTSKQNPNVTGTIHSGGNQGDPNFNYYPNPLDTRILPTEWKINENDFSFGESIFAASGLNRFNNPNITIQIDVRHLFRLSARQPLNYPHDITNKGGIKVKNIGWIKYNSRNKKVYKRNSILYFRLSAGMPGTLNERTGVYHKRIYSDLSIPIYISPKIALFRTDGNNTDAFFMYGHNLSLGMKK